MQVGARQSNVPVSNPSDRSAAAQRCLLRHRGTSAALRGYPQTDRHPVYTSTERAVSTPPVLITSHFSLTLAASHFATVVELLFFIYILFCIYEG